MIDDLEIETLLSELDNLDESELLEIAEAVEQIEKKKYVEEAYNNLLKFAEHMMDEYKTGTHHKQLAKLLMEIESAVKDRICVNIAPRHGKSQLVSIFFIAWYIGRNPTHKIMLVSHTADLAVDFGRKVRNLVNSDAYREIFPNVSISADSKSAGRWNTNRGGEFYACFDPYTKIRTKRGEIEANDVTLSDELLTEDGYRKVLAVFNTTHNSTVSINNTNYSKNHLLWTLNKGWITADSVCLGDYLTTGSILFRLKALIWRLRDGYLEYTHVPEMVQHKISLRESQERKVSLIWRTRHIFVRKVAEFFKLFEGYGLSAIKDTHCGSSGQSRSLLTRELQMGYANRAGKQQTSKRSHWEENNSATCTGIEIEAGNFAVSYSARSECFRSIESPEEKKEELQNPRYSKTEKWINSLYIHFFAGSSRQRESRKPRNRIEKYMAGLRRSAENVFGFLLGVQKVTSLNITEHENKEFLNFRVDDTNTLFTGGVLTHNCGVGSALAGRGAHLLVIDDPHSEQDILNGNYEVFDKAYEWFTYGARTRLMKNGRIAIIQTRWHASDLTGRVVQDMAQNDKTDQYYVVEFPAILEVQDKNTGDIVEKALWPEMFDLEALHRIKAGMPLFQWNAQYQQNPTAEEAALIKREWWRPWKKDKPPKCEYLIITLDAAAETHNRADFTGITVWGVFMNEEEDAYQIILLDCIKKRYEFPELKSKSIEVYNTWEPDSFIVEKKSAGAALYQEMRRMGIPVQEYTPHRGSGDKVARVNSVADIVSSGMVWVPETRWAEELVDEVASFPFGSNDDLVDCTFMALARFRQGGFIRLPTDMREEQKYFKRRKAYY